MTALCLPVIRIIGTVAGEHGNSIDYLVRHKGLNFVDAVSALTGVSIAPINEIAGNFDFNRIQLSSNTAKARAYLNQTRHISNGVIDYLLERKLMFQEKTMNNIIFPMYDEIGNRVGAELCGITPKRFKGIAKNSEYGYGFTVRFSDDDTFDYALFFESAIDLISFMDYKLNFEKKSLKRCVLVSMAGLKMNIVKHTLKTFGGAKVVLCVDNDPARQAFKIKIDTARIGYMDCLVGEDFKDWNELLGDVKRHSKPIQRLLNRGLTF